MDLGSGPLDAVLHAAKPVITSAKTSKTKAIFFIITCYNENGGQTVVLYCSGNVIGQVMFVLIILPYPLYPLPMPRLRRAGLLQTRT